jgi:hypothetical protein
MMGDKFVVCTPTQEEYNRLMEWAEAEGFAWSNRPATQKTSNYDAYKERTAVCLQRGRNRLSYAPVEYFRAEPRNYPEILSFGEFCQQADVRVLPDDFF